MSTFLIWGSYGLVLVGGYLMNSNVSPWLFGSMLLGGFVSGMAGYMMAVNESDHDSYWRGRNYK